jgi:hypothetical protein
LTPRRDARAANLRTLGSVGDRATQPAITSTGDDLYVCVNHLISTNTNYEIRTYRLSSGFTAWESVGEGLGRQRACIVSGAAVGGCDDAGKRSRVAALEE